jgi:hypothetical protein
VLIALVVTNGIIFRMLPPVALEPSVVEARVKLIISGLTPGVVLAKANPVEAATTPRLPVPS